LRRPRVPFTHVKKFENLPAAATLILRVARPLGVDVSRPYGVLDVA
jgi:hypothetical protein